MKKFAFPLSIKCANEAESDQCVALLEYIGYKPYGLCGTRRIIATNYSGYSDKYASIADFTKLEYDRHHIDHFNPELIRDIAATCTNDEWCRFEPVIRPDGSYGHTNDMHMFISVKQSCHRRPTLAEICEHYGYEIKGRDIVRKEREPKIKTIPNCHEAVS